MEGESCVMDMWVTHGKMRAMCHTTKREINSSGGETVGRKEREKEREERKEKKEKRKERKENEREEISSSEEKKKKGEKSKREKRERRRKEERKERKETSGFFLRSTAFRQLEFVGPRSKVRLHKEGYVPRGYWLGK